jgi:hypothetical protein
MMRYELCRKFEIFSTTRVGAGSSDPNPANILANTGTMKVSMAMVTPVATMLITIGYIIAPLTLRIRASAFSRYPARRIRMTSSAPPISPASTMLVNSWSNTLG